MGKSVTEVYAQLYHYTTAAGLKGIVESQQLRATNIAYLNDSEEHTGFFDRRLPYLLEEPVRSVAEKMASTEQGQNQIEANGGLEHVIQQDIQNLVDTFRTVTLKLNKPYITAFCGVPKQSPDDGLLSQWRGYGTDGGYAIVFETDELQRLLDEESKNFHYQFYVWGDVEYYDQDTLQNAPHPETIEWEKAVQKAISGFFSTNKREELDGLVEPITALSCTHKHKGFAEESEVRIVAIPSNAELFKLAQDSGDKRPRKPVQFEMKNGVLVPYIMLFGRPSAGDAIKLPIRKIIVGPHPDKYKRQKAVELMLEQNGVVAEVTVSDIPYLGR